MKSSILRAGLALACAAALASCGGGNRGELILFVAVTGVTQDGLVVTNNGGSDLAIPANPATTPRFPGLIPSDSVYNVAVKSVPKNVASIADCKVLNPTGNSGLYNVTVQINCTIKTHPLGGTVTGLKPANTGLILANGADQVAIAPGPVPADPTQQPSVTFSMKPVSEGYPYGITVLQQPSGATCTVANGVGTLQNDVTNVAVTCS